MSAWYAETFLSQFVFHSFGVLSTHWIPLPLNPRAAVPVLICPDPCVLSDIIPDALRNPDLLSTDCFLRSVLIDSVGDQTIKQQDLEDVGQQEGFLKWF